MGKCFLYGNGSSGGLSLITGLSEPTSPKENAIWVKSANAVKKCVFSAEEPENPVEGLIWFRVASPGIITRTDVYTSGTWNATDTYMYLSGAWVQIAYARTYLTNLADQCAGITGGWNVIRWYWDSNATGNVATVTWEDDGAHITATKVPGPGGMIITINAIDLTNYCTITIKCSSVIDASTAQGSWCIVSTANGDKFNANEASRVRFVNGINTLDISGLSGEYYIGLVTYYRSSVVVEETYLE